MATILAALTLSLLNSFQYLSMHPGHRSRLRTDWRQRRKSVQVTDEEEEAVVVVFEAQSEIPEAISVESNL